MRTSLFILLLATISTTGNAMTGPTPGRQDPAIVAEHVEAFLREQASLYSGSVELTVDTSRIDKQPPCDKLQAFLASGPTLRPRMSIGVRCTNPESWVAYVQAHLSIKGTYYVATHNVKPGVTLSSDDLSAREGDLLSLSPNTILDRERMIGLITTQRIRVGAPIKSGAVRSPDSIQRGEKVRLLATGDGFVATSEGQAIQGGATGAQIQVRTPSGQVVSGTVVNAHTVQVIM